MNTKIRSFIPLLALAALLALASLACRQGGGVQDQLTAQPAGASANPTAAPTQTQEQPSPTAPVVSDEATPTVQEGSAAATPDPGWDELEKELDQLNSSNQEGDDLLDLP
jgi:hypothetical protein